MANNRSNFLANFFQEGGLGCFFLILQKKDFVNICDQFGIETLSSGCVERHDPIDAYVFSIQREHVRNKNYDVVISEFIYFPLIPFTLHLYIYIYII